MPSILASPSSPPATAPATPPLAMAEGAAEALSRKLKSILDWSRPSVYSPNERPLFTNYPTLYPYLRLPRNCTVHTYVATRVASSSGSYWP